jgi:hypothetical protein
MFRAVFWHQLISLLPRQTVYSAQVSSQRQKPRAVRDDDEQCLPARTAAKTGKAKYRCTLKNPTEYNCPPQTNAVHVKIP